MDRKRKHSRRSSRRRSPSTTHQHPAAAETKKKHHHKKKKSKRKSSKSHERDFTPASTDSSPCVRASSQQPQSERRLITLRSAQQHQPTVINDVDDLAGNHNIELTGVDQCSNEDNSHHTTTLTTIWLLLLMEMIAVMENLLCYLKLRLVSQL